MSKLVAVSDLAYLSYPVVPLRGLLALARLHGTLRYLRDREARAAVSKNLADMNQNLQPVQLEQQTRRFFEYLSARNLLFILTPRMSDETLSRLFPISGLDRLDAAMAMKRGVILLSSHLNSLSVFSLVMMLRRRGYDVRVAVTTSNDNWSDSWVRKVTGRRSYFEHIGAFQCQFNVRPIVRALAEGAVVVQTGDGWHSAGFVEVDFLNRRLPFTTGMLRIAQQTGAAVVPIFAAGTPPERLQFIIEEPFRVSKTDAVEDRVAAYAKRLEHYVLAQPECWQHWLIPNALEHLAAVPSQTLQRRYTV